MEVNGLLTLRQSRSIIVACPKAEANCLSIRAILVKLISKNFSCWLSAEPPSSDFNVRSEQTILSLEHLNSAEPLFEFTDVESVQFPDHVS